jgi:hypothetical protein
MFRSNVTYMYIYVNQWGQCDLKKHDGNNRAATGCNDCGMARLTRD